MPPRAMVGSALPRQCLCFWWQWNPRRVPVRVVVPLKGDYYYSYTTGARVYGCCCTSPIDPYKPYLTGVSCALRVRFLVRVRLTRTFSKHLHSVSGSRGPAHNYKFNGFPIFDVGIGP